MTYRSENWYWAVVGNASQVYSSAAAAYVATSDSTYLAWVLAGNTTTKIDSEASLWDVLTQQFPAGIAANNAAGQAVRQSDQENNMDQVALKVLFNHENRIRVLEAKAAITIAQFVAAIRALL